jgi:hypothetical protein
MAERRVSFVSDFLLSNSSVWLLLGYISGLKFDPEKRGPRISVNWLTSKT